eukprot:8686614-Alexandrium_andersonii.AAC.1
MCIRDRSQCERPSLSKLAARNHEKPASGTPVPPTTARDGRAEEARPLLLALAVLARRARR